MASWGREVMFHDPDRNLLKLGDPVDRNVELLIEAPFEIAAAPQETILTYTGDRSAQVGSTAQLSALLTTVDGSSIEGARVTFSRDGRVVTDLTDASGLATGEMRIPGPPRNDLPVLVDFEGSPGYLPVKIVVDFTATSGSSRANHFPI